MAIYLKEIIVPVFFYPKIAGNGTSKKGVHMAEELNIATPEGAETSFPSFHEKIGNMKYNVELHFAEKGGPTLRDRLRRVIIFEANTRSDGTKH